MRLGVATIAAVLLAAAPAAAEPVDVKSFDGTKISAEFTPADGLAEGAKAPVMMLTHGFGLTREQTEAGGTSFATVPAPKWRAAGYSTFTWDARGFGRSGGEVSLDDPKVDGRDVTALIDYLATRTDVQLDGSGDPRAGMHGGSYGGAIQWANTVNDHRVDAISPVISFVDLPDALLRDGRVKLGWGAGLTGLGVSSGLLVGLPALETGTFPPELIGHVAASVPTGTASPEFIAYMDARDTEGLLGRVTAPALVVQGTADTIFSPSQAMKMWSELKVPKKMLWFCGGHAACLTGNAIADRTEQRTIAWMDRYVREVADAEIGPRFEWVADDNVVREAADYPLAPAGELAASGAGSLALASGSSTSGAGIAATPGTQAITIPIEPRAGEVTGEPVVTLRYTGTATPEQTHVYAQVIDQARNLAIGNQVTPLPVTLDGQPHEVTRSLEALAMHVTPESRFALQIVPDTTVYGISQTAGTIDVTEAKLTIGLGDPAATVAPPCRARVTVRFGRKLRRLRVRLDGTRVTSRRRGRRVRVAVDPGAHRIVVRGHTRAGKRVKVVRRVRACA